MDLPDFVILALIEGLAQLLPVGATAHRLFTAGAEARHLWLALAVAPAGTVLAGLMWNGRALATMVVGLWRLAKGRRAPGAALAGHFLLATVPAMLVAWWSAATMPLFDGPRATGLVLVGGAVVLWLADNFGMTVRRTEHMSASGAFALGLAQAAGSITAIGWLLPTLVLGRLMGYERPDCFRFSVLAALGPMAVAAVCRAPAALAVPLPPLAEMVVTGAAALALTLVILSLAQSWLRRRSLAPFLLYRLLAGGGLLAWAWLG